MENIIPIGEFKTHCYQILEQANIENKHLTITKRGHPFAHVIPIIREEDKVNRSILGSFKGRAEINGDIMAPLNTSWNAENE